MFEPYGRVEDVRVVRASFQGSEGEADLGLVDMSCTREATNAKKMLDGVQLRGCPLSVSFDLQRRAQAPDHIVLMTRSEERREYDSSISYS